MRHGSASTGSKAVSEASEEIEVETNTEQRAESSETPNEIAARRLGWRPKTEYNGPPEKYVDADEFMRRTDESVPLLRQNYRALHERFSQVERKLADTTQVLQEFREFSSRAEQRAYERAKRELEEKQRAAVAHADTEGFEKAAAEIAELERSKPKPAPEPAPEPRRQAPELDPRITGWIGENPWYNTDGELRAFASAYDQYLMSAKPGMDIGERLSAVKAKTMAEFPDKFGNSRREAPTSVAAPAAAAAPRRKNGRTYDDLPPEAKKACDKFVAQFKGSKTPYTREDY